MFARLIPPSAAFGVIQHNFLGGYRDLKLKDRLAEMAERNVSAADKSGDNIFRVYCRFRPLNAREKQLGKDEALPTQNLPPLVDIVSGQCLTFDGRQYLFDGIFDGSCTQGVFFAQTVEPLLNQFICEEYDLTILTYGQTSSGKTWTIDGSFYHGESPIGKSADYDDKDYGILPRVLQRLCLDSNDGTTQKDDIKIAFYEIYCEKIIDLLALTPGEKERKEIKLFENKHNDSVELRGLTWLDVPATTRGYESMRASLFAARSHRHFASTEMNHRSSRSHAILDICVRPVAASADRAQEKHLRIIDLAGSERLAKTQSSGQVMREGIKINESLMYLKRLIDFLAEKKEQAKRETNCIGKERYQPGNTVGLDYRSTKLTRLLFSTFRTGRSRVILILCCSPSRDNVNETSNTLEFGNNARLIRTQLRQMQKQNHARKQVMALEQIAKQQAKTQCDLEEKNQLIAAYRAKIDEYETSITALNVQLDAVFKQVQTSKPPPTALALPSSATATQTEQPEHDKVNYHAQQQKLAEEREARRKSEEEKAALIKRLELFEKAYRRSCETMKMQEDIIQRNAQDMMEMQNEINFFSKFTKNLKKMISNEE